MTDVASPATRGPQSDGVEAAGSDDAGAEGPDTARAPRVAVVGAGTRFLSAMSYYTLRLTNAFSERHDVALIPIRRMLPQRFYPGAARVGSATPDLGAAEAVSVLPSVDWYGLPSLPRAMLALARWRPDVVIFQWWTGTVLHSYLALALVARLRGASIVIEFHEVLDTGEERMRFARWYVRLVAPVFIGLADGFVIHSESDREPLHHRYRLGRRPIAVIPHGPFDHHVIGTTSDDPDDAQPAPLREAPADCFNLLFFGLIRPYKGLEHLVAAFDGLDEHEVETFWLTVVGETWEGWTLPVERIANSRYRDRITFVNRWVPDEEFGRYVAGADAAVLPYLRSSASAPASVAMSHGLPLVITRVGGLPEAVGDYEGAILVPPADVSALQAAIRRLPAMRDQRFTDPHSWDRTIDSYDALIDRVRRARVDRRRQGRRGR
jgi:glycosyltransferase involved in cell wall biosynthesis